MHRKHYILPAITLLVALTATAALYFASATPLEHRVTIGDKTFEQFFQEAANFGTKQQTPQTVTFLAVGDISLSRNIAATIKAKADPLYPFTGVDALLKSTDFNFGNLETPFSSSDAFTASNTLVFNAPKANVAGLKAYNFTVLNLANNHAFDQELDGIRTTTRVLDANGISHVGTGESLEEAWQPVVVESNGIRIGFIGASYASVNDGGKTKNNYVARIDDLANLQSAISNLQSKSDFIVVTMHAGTEYTSEPNRSQIDFAHAAVDAGADMVIGHHSHWVQAKEYYCPRIGSPPNIGGVSGGIEIDSEHSDSSATFANSDRSNCKPIYYGLGNFIFDQAWSEETKKGLALKLTVSKSTQSGHSGSSPNIGEARWGIMDSASSQDLQPASNPPPAGGPTSPLTLTIEEIPIYIKDNCCPTISQ